MLKKDKHLVREFKEKHSFLCLQGRCKSCSRIVNGKGIHDVEIYQVYECDDDVDCDECNGHGYKRITCPECDGIGEIEETCDKCNGKKKLPDECGDKTFIKNEQELVRK
jgi:hypothetical protein